MYMKRGGRSGCFPWFLHNRQVAAICDETRHFAVWLFEPSVNCVIRRAFDFCESVMSEHISLSGLARQMVQAGVLDEKTAQQAQLQAQRS